jgi:hypothetical protein
MPALFLIVYYVPPDFSRTDDNRQLYHEDATLLSLQELHFLLAGMLHVRNDFK